MKDNHNLQVVQNKLNRLLLDADRNTSTCDLLKETDSLSIQQMIAYQTAVAGFRVMKSNKPVYIANKMKVKNVNVKLRGRHGSIFQPGYSLYIAKEGFIYRAASIINKLDDNLRNEENLAKFKVGTQEWVKNNIAVKPRLRHPNLTAGSRIQGPGPLQTHQLHHHRLTA